MKKTSGAELSKKLKISPAKGNEAVIKARLISSLINAIEENNFTHADVARISAVPRSAVTGILSGSLLKVSLERVLRLLEAVNLTVHVTVRKAA